MLFIPGEKAAISVLPALFRCRIYFFGIPLDGGSVGRTIVRLPLYCKVERAVGQVFEECAVLKMPHGERFTEVCLTNMSGGQLTNFAI